jgi:hypothetical protein
MILLASISLLYFILYLARPVIQTAYTTPNSWVQELKDSFSISKPKDDSFTVTYSCENCGNRWKSSYGLKAIVKEADSEMEFSGVGMKNNDGTKRITCPVCEVSDFVNIIDRSPVE